MIVCVCVCARPSGSTNSVERFKATIRFASSTLRWLERLWKWRGDPFDSESPCGTLQFVVQGV
eukprot:8564866-Alexandrium_andersonii.AAC.1